jgi:hypothetical protein
LKTNIKLATSGLLKEQKLTTDVVNVKYIRQSEIANAKVGCKENKYSTGIAELEFLYCNA